MTDFPAHERDPGGDGAGVKDAAQERAQQVAGQAKSTLRDQVDQRSTDAGSRVNATAQDVKSVGDELRKQGKHGPARIADQAADRAERLGGYLENAGGDRILHDVEDAARSNPWAVALGGLALGFAASRLLKASSAERYTTRSAGTPSLPSSPPPGAGAPALGAPTGGGL
jgi:hypothetical protein